MEDHHKKILDILKILQEEYKYLPGQPRYSIHSAVAIKFFYYFLNAHKDVIELLTNGLRLNDSKLPRSYIECNNRTAIENHDFALRKTEEYVLKGSVKELAERPKFINPLTVASKIDYESRQPKYRLVIDLSRCVNTKEISHTYRPDSLDILECLYEKGDYATSLDMRSMYHHLSIHEDFQSYFGYQLFDKSKQKFRFFNFTKLPFGFSNAGFLMNKITTPIISFCRKLGIRIGIFIDDIIILGRSFSETKLYTDLVVALLTVAGFSLSHEKCVFEPTQCITYQGHILDFNKWEYRISEAKKEFILDEIDFVLQKSHVGLDISAKKLSSVLGKILSVRKARGNILMACLRHSQHLLGKKVLWRGPEEEPDWSVQVSMDKQAIEEMRFARKIIRSVKSRQFPSVGPKKVFSLQEEVFFSETDFDLEKGFSIMASDASDRVAFVFEAENLSLVEEFHFSNLEIGFGSGRRELLSISKSLETRPEAFTNSGLIFWLTDSINVYYFLRRGSRHFNIQQEVLKIKMKELELGCEIIPLWRPRSSHQMVLADLGSKLFKSTDEWSVDKGTFTSICRQFGLNPTVDGFATRKNSFLNTFFSKMPQYGCAGVNFFSQKLSDKEVYWLTPPVNKVVQTIKHVLATEDRIIAIISFPEWNQAVFWPYIVQGDFFAGFVRAVVYSRPHYVKFNDAPCVFQGKKNFRHISILVNNKFLNNKLEYRM